MTATISAAYASRLRAAAHAYHLGRIDYDAFDARQRETWRAVEARGEQFVALVLAALRGAAEGR